MQNLNGWRTIIVALIWFVYELFAYVAPELTKPDQGAVEALASSLIDVLGPVVMVLMRLVTNGPVGWRKPE